MKRIIKPSNSSSSLPDKQDDDLTNHDALDIYNHQRLPVLFCTFYSKNKSTSSYCVQPSLLNMTFYGANDIMLGKFLEYYCFQRSYMCSLCNLPMLDHLRRYEELRFHANSLFVLVNYCVCLFQIRSLDGLRSGGVGQGP